MTKHCQDKGVENAPVEIINGNILEYDWHEADILYIAAVCFPISLLEALAESCRNLKKGSRVLSLKELPSKPHLTEYANIFTKMSWGCSKAHFYRVV